MKRESFQAILSGIGLFVCFLLLASARTTGGFSPFALGFFVALVYAKRNLFVSAPLYVLAIFITRADFAEFSLAVFPVLVVFVAYFLHYKLKRPISLLTTNICAFIAQVPTMLYSLYIGETAFYTATNAVLTQIFAFCSTLCLYAVLVRGMKTKFTVDESICTGVVATALCLGLYTVRFFGITPLFLVASFCSVVMTYSLGSIGLVSGVVFGLAGALGGDYAIFLPMVVGCVFVLAFRTTSPYVASIAYLASVIGLNTYFSSLTGFSVAEGVCVAIGSLAFCALPKQVKGELSAYLTAFREPKGERHVINRHRKTTARRLSAAAKVFWDLSSLVSDTAWDMSDDERSSHILTAVEREFCGTCSKKDQCDYALMGKRRDMLYPVVEVAIKRGRATLLELPAYVTSSCVKVNDLIPLVNRIKDDYIEILKQKVSSNGGKIVFAEQLLGVGELLAGLSQEMRRVVGFDVGRERTLVDELSYKNILCSEAIIEEDGESVTLLVKEGEARRRAIEKITSKVMRKKMSAKVEKSPTHKGFDTVLLSSTPIYDMAFGEAVEKKRGEEKNGDSRLVTRPSIDTYVMAIADGMGSGERAEKSSSTAISLVESFYKAGFSHKTVINLVNKMLNFTEG
ncbi:MAG: hypothetical protein IKB20_03790, partial [Clostridia bacterium]|nr:hypothetical protein [Clostridia bacterium]